MTVSYIVQRHAEKIQFLFSGFKTAPSVCASNSQNTVVFCQIRGQVILYQNMILIYTLNTYSHRQQYATVLLLAGDTDSNHQ